MTLLCRVRFDIGHPTLVWTSLERVPSVKGATIKSITWFTLMTFSLDMYVLLNPQPITKFSPPGNPYP